MRNIRTALALFALPAFFSCSPESVPLSSSATADSSIVSDFSSSEEIPYHEEFSEYYGQGGLNGLDLFAWDAEGEWMTGLMTGTSRLKTVEEVGKLQEKPCPLPIMKDILATYAPIPEDGCTIFIVSVPPLESELDHSYENVLKNKDAIVYLCEYFGLDPAFYGF